jgi:hypothetical protein
MLQAEIGDIVTWTDPTGRAHIGRVAAVLEIPPDYAAPRRLTVATPEGGYLVERDSLRVVRPNFVQETWNALGHSGLNPWGWPEPDDSGSPTDQG